MRKNKIEGAIPNAGRKNKFGESTGTVSVRVPLSILENIKKIINLYINNNMKNQAFGVYRKSDGRLMSVHLTEEGAIQNAKKHSDLYSEDFYSDFVTIFE